MRAATKSSWRFWGAWITPIVVAWPALFCTGIEDVWVLDTDNLRATLFGPDGRMLNAISLEAPALNFAPVGGDAVVVPATVLTVRGRSNSQDRPPLVVARGWPGVASRHVRPRRGSSGLVGVQWVQGGISVAVGACVERRHRDCGSLFAGCVAGIAQPGRSTHCRR